MRWKEFSAACPELATPVRQRFEREQIMLLGTIRADGMPRISALECDFAGDDLMTGMIWRSVKALDLLRDGRVTIHSLVPDKAHEGDNQGDLKLYGRAVEVTDAAAKQAYERAIQARIDWAPSEPYHCFVFDITGAGLVRFSEGGRDSWGWTEADGLRQRRIQEFGPEPLTVGD